MRPLDFDAPYPPLDLGSPREGRTAVGLRPFRPGGFRIEAERFGDRTIVHNYGHGGGGVTLSWGSAGIAVAEPAMAGVARAAVIGAGIIGLTTAATLLKAGVATSVYADAFPPATTSNAAGAVWLPASHCRAEAVGAGYWGRFRGAARASCEMFRAQAGAPRYGVSWIRMLEFADAPPTTPRSPRPEGDDLYPGLRGDAGLARRFGFAFADRFAALMIDPDLYLGALVEDVAAAGGRLVRRRFASLGDALSLDEPVIFNCAGSGAGALFGDDSLLPVRGQITFLEAQPAIDYGYVYEGSGGLLYMFPRAGAIALGGSMAWGETSLAVDDNERARILEGHAAIAARIRQS